MPPRWCATRTLRKHKGRHLIISAVEHPSVQAPAERLRAEGWKVTALPVDEYGRVAPAQLAAAAHSLIDAWHSR